MTAKDKDLELSLRISADGKTAVESIRRVGAEVDDLGKASDDTSDDLRDLGAASAEAESDLGGLGAGAERGAEGIETLGRALGAYLSLDFLKRVGSAASEAAAAREALEKSVTFAAGGTEAGAQQLERLEQVAGRLRKPVNEMADAWVRLKNLGLDPSAEALEAYANVAAANRGKSLTDFVEAVADASVGEFERLKEFGIKAGVQGDQVALRFRGNTTLIANDAKSIEEALQRIGQVEFAGAATSQIVEITAETQRLSKEIDETLVKLARDTGLNEGLADIKGGVADLLDAFNQAAPEAEKTTTAMGALTSALELMLNPAGAAVKNIDDLGAAYGGSLSFLADWIRTADEIPETIEQAAEKTAELTDKQREAADAAQAVANGTREIAAGSAQATEQQRRLAEQMEGLTAAADEQAKALGEAFKALGVTREQLAGGLGDGDRKIVDAFATIVDSGEVAGADLERAFSAALERITAEGVTDLSFELQRALGAGLIADAGVDRALDGIIVKFGQTADAAERAGKRIKDAMNNAAVAGSHDYGDGPNDEYTNADNARLEQLRRELAAYDRKEIGAVELGDRLAGRDTTGLDPNRAVNYGSLGRVDPETGTFAKKREGGASYEEPRKRNFLTPDAVKEGLDAARSMAESSPLSIPVKLDLSTAINDAQRALNESPLKAKVLLSYDGGPAGSGDEIDELVTAAEAVGGKP